MYICPVCRKGLFPQGKSLVCENRHTYDVAREGYVNLLPVQKKHARDPGDTKEMVEARRAFLDRGFYTPFRETAKEVMASAATPGTVYLDAGCGEGYYTRVLSEGMDAFAFDISKCAVRAAAKRDGHTLYAVAGSYDIPFPDGGADFLTAIFSPIAEREFRRVVRPGGYLMIAVPTERHLFGLKTLLYDAPYENEYRETDYPGFRQVERVRRESVLETDDNGAIRSLFAMTPYFWKSSKETSRRAMEADTLRTEIGFDFILYRRED